MLSSRSTRLAAALLLALLSGWMVRACRKGGATPPPPLIAPAPASAPEASGRPSFPDE